MLQIPYIKFIEYAPDMEVGKYKKVKFKPKLQQRLQNLDPFKEELVKKEYQEVDTEWPAQKKVLIT